jgi:hypothetical protein
MATIARLFSRDVPEANADFGALKTVGLFCAAGLFVSLIFAPYGLDLSVGFF